MNNKPEPKACAYCGHMYFKPCDGASEDCPNRIWRMEHNKRMEFAALCGKHLIAPEIATENANLLHALSENNMAEVERILQEEF